MDTKKKKVLIIPSYFPTPEKPIVGTQINEQAILLSKIYDVKVLYCTAGVGWKRQLFNSISGVVRGRRQITPLPIDFSFLSSLHVIYNRYFQHRKVSYSKNENWMVEAYADAYIEQLYEKNWIPDLIHSRGFEKGGIVANFLSSKYNIPYVHTENTGFLFDAAFSEKKLDNFKKVLTEAKRLTFVSNFLARNTLMHGFLEKSDWRVIPNPIDSQKFKPGFNDQKDSNIFKVLIVGYNSFIKDFPTFFRAVAVAQQQGIPVEATIAMTYGNLSDEEKLHKMAERFNVKELKIKSAVSRAEMAVVIRTFDVVVSTSIIETFGIALCESLFSGVPVISTRNGGAEDFVNSKNGILVRIGDHEAIAQGLADIFYKRLNFEPEEVRRSVENNFSNERYISELSRVYEEI